MRKKNRNAAICTIGLLFLTIILLLIHQEYNANPTIESVKYENKYNEDRTRKVILDIRRHNSNRIYCQFVDDKISSK